MPRRRWFNVLALPSLVMLAIALPGYVGNVGVVEKSRVVNGVGFPPQVTVARIWQLSEGRFAVATAKANALPSLGRSRQWFAVFRPRLSRQSFGGFDAHPFPPNAPTSLAYLFAFPLWCVVVPCLIIEMLWLLDWRRRRGLPQSGFPMDVQAAAAAVKTQTGSP